MAQRLFCLGSSTTPCFHIYLGAHSCYMLRKPKCVKTHLWLYLTANMVHNIICKYTKSYICHECCGSTCCWSIVTSPGPFCPKMQIHMMNLSPKACSLPPTFCSVCIMTRDDVMHSLWLSRE